MMGVFSGVFQNASKATPVLAAKGKVAVVFFSWSPDGSTRFAAEAIARKLEAKTFEIKTQTPYSPDYRRCCDEAKPECHGRKPRPIQPVAGLDLSQYEVLLVGTPNWWGTMAPPVRTWLTQNVAALQGKAVCLFQTNGGGGMQRCGKEFAELLPNSRVLPAEAFSGGSIRRNVAALEKFATDRVTVKETT